MNNKIFINKKTKEEYVALPTNEGKIKIFSLTVDDGGGDIIIDKEEFNKNYDEISICERKATERFGDLVDVCSPQECADLFDKPVKDGETIYYPKTKEGK